MKWCYILPKPDEFKDFKKIRKSLDFQEKFVLLGFNLKGILNTVIKNILSQFVLTVYTKHLLI